MCVVFSVFLILIATGPSCINSDNLALLAGTLKTMQRAACDDEIVALACPRGTSISIQVAQYGKATPESHTCMAEKPNPQVVSGEVVEEKCLWPNAMQYSLLQTVVEACQKKPQCKFSTKPKPGLVDPCPLARKFVEVAYKCRPYEFRSRTGCEGEVIKLSCNPHSRVAVFDAQFGRIPYDSIACPQVQGVPEESCNEPYAAERVMQICHGKRRCQIAANSKTFGSPCRPDSKPYLKVIYACVPLGVLTERYESAAEKDETLAGPEFDQDEDLFDESDGAGEKWGESNAVPPVADSALLPPEDVTAPSQNEDDTTPISTKIPVTIQTHKGLNSFTKTIIYVAIGLLVFIVAIVIIIGIRCYFAKQAERRSKNGDMFTTEAPNVFNDAVSDIDNDIDVSHISGTFYDPLHPDMILYRDVPGSRGTLRAMRPLATIYPCSGANMYGNVDFVPHHQEGTRFDGAKEDPTSVTSPKSLGGYSNSQFYYG